MDLRNFVDDVLYPAIWQKLNEVFPEMRFYYTLGKWRSPYKIDGSEPDTPRKDKTVVTQRLFHVALENGGGDAKGRARDLISLYMEHNNITERIEALKELSQKLGLRLPDGGDASKYEEARKRKEQLVLSYDRQKRALFNPEGAEVLRYLKEERGYSEELIREMGLGYISPDEARHLEESCKVGIAWNVTEYPLSIAYFSRGSVMGFKFRSIKPIGGKPKYMNTRSLGTEGMDSHPFGLVPNSLNLGDKKDVVVVVEGELDALHAIALGLPNVIAVAGGKVTEGKARTLKESGYKNVVILLDADAEGQRFTAESIEIIDNTGLNSFVATLPGAKDVDEYLQKNTIDELREIIKDASFGGLWLFANECKKFDESPKSAMDLSRILEEYVSIASRYKDHIKQEMLRAHLLNIDTKRHPFNIEDIEAGIKRKIQQRIEEQEQRRRRELAEESLRKASSLLNSGETKKAEAVTKKALEILNEANKSEEYSFLLEDNTDELWELYKKSLGGIHTHITLKHLEGNDSVEYPLIFPPGAISVIGAQSNHGKSKLLLSTALDALDTLEEGDTLLYIVYEESDLNVNAQALNAYADLYVKPRGKMGGNLGAITKYLRSGDANELEANTREAFLKKEEEWKNIRRSSKIKIVKPQDSYLETLMGIIDFAVKNLNIKAIFIDYVQEIYVRNWNKGSRPDELKEAMVQLDEAAQKTSIPIILAAQLNREANSPLALFNRTLADSAWIERKASEILLIWSSAQKLQTDVTPSLLKRIENEIETPLGDKFPPDTSGKLYVKLTKSRIIPPGSHAIITINGSTGRVLGETKRKKKNQQATSHTTLWITPENLGDDNTEPENKDLPF